MHIIKYIKAYGGSVYVYVKNNEIRLANLRQFVELLHGIVLWVILLHHCAIFAYAAHLNCACNVGLSSEAHKSKVHESIRPCIWSCFILD